ncbi:MAG: hypothetical protein GX878_08920 [Firmicutes bacterium]|nr:hypothetical protein [Bacillota bacterium]
MLPQKGLPLKIRDAFLLLAIAFLVIFPITAEVKAQEPYPEMTEGLLPQEEPAPQSAPLKQPDRPLVLITEVTTGPDPIIPGEPFILKLKMRNYGNQEGRRIVVTLQSLEGETTLKHFSPLGQSNTLYLGHLPVGSEKWLQCNLIAGPGVAGGIYNLVLHLSYINWEGEPFESTAVTGLMLEPQGTLDLIELNYPGLVTEGESFGISGYVVNSGGAPVRGVGIVALHDDNFQAVEGETYFGTFNEGDSDIFDFSIVAMRSGKNALKLELYYSDAMNRKQVIEKDLQIEVMEIKDVFSPNGDGPPEKKNNSEGFWARFKTFLCALFGLGGS